MGLDAGFEASAAGSWSMPDSVEAASTAVTLSHGPSASIATAAIPVATGIAVDGVVPVMWYSPEQLAALIAPYITWDSEK